MGDEDIARSSSGLNAVKSSSLLLSKSFKAASTILKSISSMNSKRSQPDLQSKKSVGNLTSDKSETSARMTQSKSNEKFSSKDQIRNPDFDRKPGNNSSGRKRTTKFMRDFPELFRDDVSIHPSYTALMKFPYNVVCRRRFHKIKSKINRQLNKEIENITMTQTLALDGVRVDRIFSVGFPISKTIVKDFASSKERRRLNGMLEDR